MRPLNTIILSALVLAGISVAAFIVWVPANVASVSQIAEPKQSQVVDQPKQQLINQPNQGVVMGPRGPDMSETRTLEDAQRQVDFVIKLPSKGVPAGFSLKGVIATRLSPEKFEGKLYNVSQATLIYWNKSTTQRTNIDTIEEEGGLFIDITKAPGNRTIEGFANSIRAVEVRNNQVVRVLDPPPGVTVKYLWGNPAIIGPKSIEVYDYKSQLQYVVRGNHPSDVLMSVIDSMVNG